MSVCTRPLCILVRLLASSRCCNCSPATRRIRCSSLRRKGLLDTGHPLHTTRNTETIFVHRVHSRRYQPIVVFVVANYSTSHRRLLRFCLSITNQCPWTGEPFRTIAIRSSSETFPFRFRPLFGIAEQLADIGASYLPRFHSAPTFCRTLNKR